jgi:predicted ATPase
MFTEVQIENYKSIQSLKINLGRVNVFIGENGCGKSNILEAIALAGAAAGNKLDNEFLAPRGIRVTEPEFMRSAFDKENINKIIKIILQNHEMHVLAFAIHNENKPYSKWNQLISITNSHEKVLDILEELTDEYILESSSDDILLGKLTLEQTILNNITKIAKEYVNKTLEDEMSDIEDKPIHNLDRELTKKAIYDVTKHIANEMSNERKKSNSILKDFLIYSPENSSLRTFEEEGQIQPLGAKGEGLHKLLRVLNMSPDKINEIKQKLELIDWFDDFKVPNSDLERVVQIKDRYLDKELPYFNQRSSNEGFLFLMFYFALFISDDTPKFFAIDNIENALNPKLCTKLIQELVELAKKYDKQVIFTTHNPAILDGLDLHDDEQRLFTIYRNIYGHTKVERIFAPQPLEDEEPVPLSEAFMNGYIGGLPDNF